MLRCFTSLAAFAGITRAAPRVIRDRASKIISVLPPKGVEPTAAVVLTHGLGDTAEGFADVAQMWANQLPHVKFVLPTAPSQPVTLNGGFVMPSWYDIHGLTDRAAETCDGIEESAATVTGLLDAEHAAGIPYDRMVLAGFSQGGALSLWTGLQLPVEKKLAGLLVMSGYLAGSERFQLTPGLEGTPILHCHGDADPMVRYEWAKASQERVTSNGATNYKLKNFPGMEHTVIEDELSLAVKFLGDLLPELAEKEGRAKDYKEMSVSQLKRAIEKAGLGKRAVGLMEKREYIQLLEETNPKDEL